MTAPAAPLVSVIMATFNCSAHVDAALESIARQTYASWELVVCDDASTDDTPQRLAAFAGRHPGRVVLLSNERNRKLAYSLNRCLEVAEGSLIARMDGDDLSRPERLAALVDHLTAHPDIQVVGSAMQRFDERGIRDVVQPEVEPSARALRSGVPFAHATICMRRDAYDALGGYTVARRTERGQDYDLWFRFFDAGFRGHNLADPLYLVREDREAVGRRSLQSRWHTFQTAIIGFRRLGFPVHWYLSPMLQLAKGLVPIGAVQVFRRWQFARFSSAQPGSGGQP